VSPFDQIIETRLFWLCGTFAAAAITLVLSQDNLGFAIPMMLNTCLCAANLGAKAARAEMASTNP
jgi:NADH:ubiquinone oxidoreductase subunit 6 (subunit J)